MIRNRWATCALVSLVLGSAAHAGAPDAKAEYELRAAQTFAGLFQSLDRNRDGVVTREEAQGDVNFLPRFDDMDIDRNGAVTEAELQRFVQQHFGVQVNVVGQR